ncbi:MAG TPA: RecX family transcriptional regulator [Nevskiaceae bacterium]|nr:RecX family transcriptional regulator [Nevskiaceae bacterium]
MKITAIKQQVKRTDRYSVFVDGTYAFSLSESGLLESRLASGQELDAASLRQLKKTAGLDKAYGNALRYVALRPRSVWELRTYLQRKAVDEHAAEQITHRLRASGFLDDLAFARAWVANRRLLKSTSRHRLQQELKQKQVSEDIIAQVLAEDTTDERQVLRDLVARKRKQTKYQDDLKLMQYLARQGYGYDDIKAAINS